jgi:hypothetical protein
MAASSAFGDDFGRSVGAQEALMGELFRKRNARSIEKSGGKATPRKGTDQPTKSPKW